MLRVIPQEKDNEKHIKKRKKLIKDIDPNGNGIISLAETQKAVRDVFKFDVLFKFKPAMNWAFIQTIGSSKSSKDTRENPDIRLGDIDLSKIGVLESEDNMKRDLKQFQECIK